MSQNSSVNFGLFQQVFDNLKLNNLAKEARRMNFKARTLKKNSFNFGFGRGAQVGEASCLEVNLRRKRPRWAYHFSLVRFRPWDPTNPRFWKKTEHNNAKQDSETATFQASVQCCVTATHAT